MENEHFSDLGRIEAIARLYENTPYKPFEDSRFECGEKGCVSQCSKVLLEGIDFDLTYFPLKHLGYKSVIAATGELYAALAVPRTLSVTLGVSAKLDFGHIKELWSGMVAAASKHGYAKFALDLVPSKNGLCIAVAASGETSRLTWKRRPKAKSMDLICISGNLGAAYLGFEILEREKKKFAESGNIAQQPDLNDYKHLVGAYLKPELDNSVLPQLEEAEIVPSHGYFITRGLSDAVKRLVRDSGLGAKIYTERIPFAGKTFDVGKELGIDPVSAAMNGGEDCRLLYTIPIGQHDKFRRDFQIYDIIGHLAKPDVGAVIVTPDGIELPLRAQGWKE